jgi:DNA excision repair protein ERCC-2
MHFSLENRTISLSVGEFAGFSLGPQEGSGGAQGLWRAQLGQHWHNELRARTEKEFTAGGALRPDLQFEVSITGRLVHRGWTFALNGRIDQQVGDTLREIKSVMRPLPADEPALRADYPAYFLQLSCYVLLVKTGTSSPERPTPNRSTLRGELIFVEAGSGLAQTVSLTPFDEALVFHQLDSLVEFLNRQLRATARRRSLQFRSPFRSLRAGQETIQSDLSSALCPPSSVVLFEAPTGYGKTGCVLEFVLGQLKAGRFERLLWLTGKSTGQIQVMHTLRLMTEDVRGDGLGVRSSNPPTPNLEPLTPNSVTPLAVWQVRNKSEHCVNHTFHCVRDGCNYLRDCAERWPGSGLSRFYLNEDSPRDLATLRAAGQAAQICPYEITRAALPFNDVWIGDFNYVFAPSNRGLFFDQPGFDPAETILVVDEAHNLPSRVAGAYSHRATESEARLLLAELDHLHAPAQMVLAVEEWTRLLATLQPAESLDPLTEAEVRDLLERLVKLTTTHPLDYATLGPVHSETLWSFATLLDFIADQNLTKLVWVARTGQLEFTCVDAAAAIGETLRPFGGVILMSATLHPYKEFAESCALEVGRGLRSAPGNDGQGTAPPTYQTLIAPTPWRTGAYDVAVDLRVDTTFRKRSTHYATTAATIVSLHEAAAAVVKSYELRVTSSGPRIPAQKFPALDAEPLTPNPTASRCVAVFFPSYAYAEAIEKTLSDYGSVLRVALQPKLPDLAAQTAWVEENLVFSDALFLVLGSSFAEGIDLLGGRVSHAMVVGPALPEVNAVQKARLSALSDLGRDAAFRRVYQIPGLQKVNQGLGRLVRAPGQKAKVLLHCRRFADPSYASLLATDYQMFQEIVNESDLCAWLGAASTKP